MSETKHDTTLKFNSKRPFNGVKLAGAAEKRQQLSTRPNRRRCPPRARGREESLAPPAAGKAKRWLSAFGGLGFPWIVTAVKSHGILGGLSQKSGNKDRPRKEILESVQPARKHRETFSPGKHSQRRLPTPNESKFSHAKRCVSAPSCRHSAPT